MFQLDLLWGLLSSSVKLASQAYANSLHFLKQVKISQMEAENARTDTYLFHIGDETTRLEETIRRARAYLQAGANSIFVPGVTDPSLIQILVREIPGPLNIMVGPGAPSVPELFKLGVARVSLGGAVMLATMGVIRDIARELREQGTYEQLALHMYEFTEAWKLFQQKG